MKQRRMFASFTTKQSHIHIQLFCRRASKNEVTSCRPLTPLSYDQISGGVKSILSIVKVADRRINKTKDRPNNGWRDKAIFEVAAFTFTPSSIKQKQQCLLGAPSNPPHMANQLGTNDPCLTPRIMKPSALQRPNDQLKPSPARPPRRSFTTASCAMRMLLVAAPIPSFPSLP